MKFVGIVAIVFLLTGCAAGEFAGHSANYATKRYCNITEETQRELIRTQIDEVTDPHEIRIRCNAE